MQTMSSRTTWALFALAAGAGLAVMLWPSRPRMTQWSDAGDENDARVDHAGDESFPASDPPSFSAPAATPALE